MLIYRSRSLLSWAAKIDNRGELVLMTVKDLANWKMSKAGACVAMEHLNWLMPSHYISSILLMDCGGLKRKAAFTVAPMQLRISSITHAFKHASELESSVIPSLSHRCRKRETWRTVSVQRMIG
jgi:hypothetical protein